MSLATDNIDDQEQAAFLAAVDRAAPAVLRIETVGGLERVGRSLFGTGPTTGLAVSPDGYIVSSIMNFANQPTAIFVQLPDGTRKPAKIVASDHSRMIVLLKIDVEKPLTVCEIAPAKEMQVGQWAVALGRTFDGARPSMTIGIVSAMRRVWGKAIQTDAAVSPNNYGGPLIDIQGRALGLLVPLSPDGSDDLAGVEWYDSGIGFAIPMEDVQNVLPRLKNGENIYPGVVGVNFKGANIYTGQPIIKACVENGPADKAGLKTDDKIVEIDGRPTNYLADVKAGLSRRYAGDKISITILRGNERLVKTLELAREPKKLAGS